MPTRILEARALALSHAPTAIKRLRRLLDSKDERVVVAAAEALLDRAGLKPYAIEPERLEVMAVPVDLDAMRARLAVQLTGLVLRGLPTGPETIDLTPAAGDATRNATPADETARNQPQQQARPLPEQGGGDAPGGAP